MKNARLIPDSSYYATGNSQLKYLAQESREAEEIELESRPSVATYQPREDRRHDVVEMNQSLRSSNGGHANICHSVPSSEVFDGESGVTYSVVKRSAKVVYSSNQHPRRFDKLAAIEVAIMLTQKQPRYRFCFKYLMSNRAKDKHEKK